MCRGTTRAVADRHENYDTISPIKNKKKESSHRRLRGQCADGFVIVMKTNRSELDLPTRAHSGAYMDIEK